MITEERFFAERVKFTAIIHDPAISLEDQTVASLNMGIISAQYIIQLQEERQTLRAECGRLREGFRQQDHEIEQLLGRALRFPLLKDCPEIGGQPDDEGVEVGPYTAMPLVDMAAERIKKLEEALEFYARPGVWKRETDWAWDGEDESPYKMDSPAQDDDGTTARAALEAQNE